MGLFSTDAASGFIPVFWKFESLIMSSMNQGSGKLYTYPDNFRAHKIQIAAKYSRFQLDPAEFVVGETDKSAEFLKKFPLGKVPAFENGKICLFEPNAIAYYVGNAQTRGGDNEAEVLQWIGVADNDIMPAACNLVMLYKHVMDPNFRAAYPNTNRWFTTCVHQMEFRNVLGKVEMCEKMAQFDGKKYNEIFGKEKKDSGKKEKKQAQPKAKKEQKPKEEKKPAAAPAPKKEKADPWANSPEATMDMDAWKRTFSNEKDDAKILEYFFKHFPSENYSVWQSNYKYNDELTMSFMASNMVGGMFQRIEKLRKHAFASVI